MYKLKNNSELLEASIDKYNSRGIISEIAIRELIELAKDMKTLKEEGEELGLTVEEKAFYDVLSKTADSDEETLIEIAKGIAKTIEDNMTIDWIKRESEKANMRIQIKRYLRKEKFKVDPAAVDVLIKQAELMAGNMV